MFYSSPLPQTYSEQTVAVSFPAAYTPICFSNDQFRFCFDDIAAIAKLYNIPLWLYGGANYKKNPEDMDFSLPSATQENMHELNEYLTRSSLALEKITPEIIMRLDFLRYYSNTAPLIQFIQMLLNNGAHLDKFYFNKLDGFVVRIIQNGIPNEIVLTKKSLLEHASGLDLSVGAMYYSILSDTSYIPYPESLYDFNHNELNFLPKDECILSGELLEDPSRFSRVARASSSSHVLIADKLENFLTSHVKTQENIFKYQQKNAKETARLSNRLYYDLQLSFFSGRAEATLEKLHELNLFEQLFGYVTDLPKEAKARTFYLVQQVAKMIDRDPKKYSPSLVYYAVHWEKIKDLPFPVNDISGISKPMIRLPDAELSNIRDAENRKTLERLVKGYGDSHVQSPINIHDPIADNSRKHFSPVRPEQETDLSGSEYTPDHTSRASTLSFDDLLSNPSSTNGDRSFSFDSSHSPLSLSAITETIEPAETKKQKSKKKKKANTDSDSQHAATHQDIHIKIPANALPTEKNAAFFFEKAQMQQKEAEHLKEIALSEHQKILELAHLTEKKSLIHQLHQNKNLHFDEALKKYNATRKFYRQALEKDSADSNILTALSTLESNVLDLEALRFSFQTLENPKKAKPAKSKKSKSGNQKSNTQKLSSPSKASAKENDDFDFLIPAYTTPSRNAEHWFQEGERLFNAEKYQDSADAYSKIITDFSSHAQFLQAYRERILANKKLGKHKAIIADANYLIKITKTQYNKTHRATQQKPYDLYEFNRTEALFQRAEACLALNIDKVETSGAFHAILQEAEKQAYEHPKNTSFHPLAAHSCFNIGISAKNSAQNIRTESDINTNLEKKISLSKLETIAIEQFKACIQWQPDFHMAYIQLGKLLQKQGRVAQAMFYYQLCLSQLQNNIISADTSKTQKDTMYNLIMRLAESMVGTLIDSLLDDLAEKKPLLTFKQLDNTQKIHLLNIGKSFYEEARKYDLQEDDVGETESLEVSIRLAEIEDCIKAINEEKDAVFYYALAEEYREAHDYQNAADNYNIAIALDSNHWLAHRKRIDINYLQEKYDLAITQCSHLIEHITQTHDISSNEYKTRYYCTLYQRARNTFARKLEKDIEHSFDDFSAVIAEYLSSNNPKLRIIASQSALQLGKFGLENAQTLKDELENEKATLSEAEQIESFGTIQELEANAEEMLNRSLEFNEGCQQARIALDKIKSAQEKRKNSSFETATPALKGTASLIGKLGALNSDRKPANETVVSIDLSGDIKSLPPK